MTKSGTIAGPSSEWQGPTEAETYAAMAADRVANAAAMIAADRQRTSTLAAQTAITGLDADGLALLGGLDDDAVVSVVVARVLQRTTGAI